MKKSVKSGIENSEDPKLHVEIQT